MTSEKLNRAVQLIKSGNKQTALPILKEIVQTNPNDENAWLWLYVCVETIEQKKYCLQQVLKINPNNQGAHKELLKLQNQTQQNLEPSHQPSPQQASKTNNSAPISTKRVNNSSSSAPKKKNQWLWIFVIGALLCIVLMFVGILITTGQFGQIPLVGLAAKTFMPTLTFEPPATFTPTTTFTPTFSPTPTETYTPTVTLTPTITNTPTSTFTATLTPTLIPMTSLAKRAKQVMVAQGFVPDTVSCGQELSCQAYISQDPYMLVVIQNDGLITVTIWDETHSMLNYAKPPGAKPPYDLEFLWYLNILDKIYNSFSPNFGITASAIMDGTMKIKKISLETDYGYSIQGSLATDQKMILTITPPK